MKAEDPEGRYQQAGKTVVATSNDIVTGEGVGLVLPTVTLGTRIISAVVDYGLYTILAGIFVYYSLRVWEPNNFAQVLTYISVGIIIWAVLLPFIVQYATGGSSLGRLITRSRTVRYDGGVIGLRHAMTRALAGLFDIHLTFGALGTISMLLTEQGQRPGDLLVGTIVVRWPKNFRGPEPHSIDHSLERWSRTATIQSIPGPLSIAARDFLRSTKHMTPETRTERGRDLAAGLERFVAPPAPRGTHPEAFIQTVLAMREVVDYQAESRRLVRQSQTEERLSTLPYSVR